MGNNRKRARERRMKVGKKGQQVDDTNSIRIQQIKSDATPELPFTTSVVSHLFLERLDCIRDHGRIRSFVSCLLY